MNEMKVREDLVFDRSGEVIGFVDVGDINSRIQALEAVQRGARRGSCNTQVDPHGAGNSD